MASKPDRKDLKRSVPSTTLSLVAHALLIFAAVKVTVHAAPSAATVVTDTSVVFLEPAQPKPAPPPKLVVPEGFQTLVAPTVTPSAIPPVDLKTTFNAKDYTGAGMDLGTAAGPLVTAPDESAGAVYAEALVDEKPELLFSPPLEYPGLLRQAGVEGKVVVQVVVDTTGRAEPNTLKVVRSSNAAFNPAAVGAVLDSRYRPGRIGGKPVRVLVEIPITFSIRRR